MSVRVPWFRLVAPTKVLAAVRVRLPKPTLRSAEVPETTPLSVSVVPAAGATVPAPVRTSAREEAKVAEVSRTPAPREMAPDWPVMTVPEATSVVVALLIAKLVPAVIAVTKELAGMLAPETGMPTYHPVVLPVYGIVVPSAPWTAVVVTVVVAAAAPRLVSAETRTVPAEITVGLT